MGQKHHPAARRFNTLATASNVHCRRPMEVQRMRFCYRSARTGRFVSAAYAKKHPKTTVRETLQVSRRAKRNHNRQLMKGTVYEI
jgi:hypothetical protein